MRAAVVAAAAALHGVSLACGVCLDDKVAAAYDHAIVVSAIERRRMVVFAEVTGPREASTLVSVAGRAAAGVSGIERRSVRRSTQPAVVSFVLDPRVRDPASALAAIAKDAGPEVTLTMLKVLGAR